MDSMKTDSRLDFNLCFGVCAVWFGCLKCEDTTIGSKFYLGVGVNREYPWGNQEIYWDVHNKPLYWWS
jgi:hypothetical protein